MSGKEIPHTPPRVLKPKRERIFHPFGSGNFGSGKDAQDFRAGTDTSDETHGRSTVFIAQYDGRCSRCNRKIEIGDDIRYHNDYPSVVHNGCHDEDWQDQDPKNFVVKGKREPKLCPGCFQYHVGECL